MSWSLMGVKGLMLCSNAKTFQHLLHAISAKGFFLEHREK